MNYISYYAKGSLYKVQKKRRRKTKTQTNKTKQKLVNLLTFCFRLSWGKMDMNGRFWKLPITMTSKTVEKKKSFYTLRTEACKCSPVANFLTSKQWITTYSGSVFLHRRAWRMNIWVMEKFWVSHVMVMDKKQMEPLIM